MKSLVVLIHSDWDLCGKGQSGHSCTEENHIRTQEDAVCKLRTEALGGAGSSASCSSSLTSSLRTWSWGLGLLKPLAVVLPVKTQPPSHQPTKDTPAQRDNKQPWPPDLRHQPLPPPTGLETFCAISLTMSFRSLLLTPRDTS